MQILPLLTKNISLFASALMLSINTFISRYVDCSMSPTAVQDKMLCFSDPTFLHLDLLTPSIYAREIVTNINSMTAIVCYVATLPANMALYPLLDFNFYVFLHTTFNFFNDCLFGVVTRTILRCKYAQSRTSYNSLERVVMCVPDIAPTASLLRSNALALGKMLDNWLNMILVIIEQTISSTAPTCNSQDLGLQNNWNLAQNLFQNTRIRICPLTQNLYAVTDGLSTTYFGPDLPSKGYTAIHNWPFQIELNYGIAAVEYSAVFDADAFGDDTTGMLGCTCTDSESDGIVLSCASIPYLAHFQDSDDEYSTATVHQIKFASGVALENLQCAKINLKVSSMRFSKFRVSKAATSNGDGVESDFFATLSDSGDTLSKIGTADAAIILEPDCGLVPTSTCLAQSACFPFCMGLHVAGKNAESITMYPANFWRDRVHIAQTDCILNSANQQDTCAVKSSVRSEAFAVAEDACLQRVCSVNDDVATDVLIQESLEDSSTTIQQSQAVDRALPNFRRKEQPFAYNGDIFVYVTQDEQNKDIVLVERLWNDNAGSFSLRFEKILLAAQISPTPVKRCDVNFEEQCYITALEENSIVLPPRTRLEFQQTQIATASMWAIHYAVNPDNALLEPLMGDRCRSGFEIAITSSYSRGRVWTIKTVRAEQQESGDKTQRVHYANLPDWLTIETPCDQVVNVKIVQLDYINEENILVTTLRSSPKNYDTATGLSSNPSYGFFFLHPNLHSCTDDADNKNNFYTCWREAKDGIWQNTQNQIQSADISYGTLCPALQRMPAVGRAFGHSMAAAWSVLQVFLEASIVLPASLSVNALADVFEPRVFKVCFHSVLDSNGVELLNFDNTIYHMKKSSFFIANFLVAIIQLFKDSVGFSQIEPVVVGTSKIMQHMQGVVPLQGPMLQILKNVAGLPTDKVLKSTTSLFQGNPILVKPSVLTTPASAFSLLTSTLELNLKMTQAFLLQILTFRVGISDFSKVLASLLYNFKFTIKRYFVDNMRQQCDGVGNIFGSVNPVARVVRNVCFLAPDNLQAGLDALLIFLVDFATVDCACKLPQQHNVQDVLERICLPQNMAFQKRSFLNGIRHDPTQATNICHSYMDEVNTQLLQCFDIVFRRLLKITEALAELLDYFTVIWDSDAASCSDYTTSPYIVSLQPEPVDYFRGCTNTFDCRVKCKDNFDAFEASLAALPIEQVPTQKLSSEVSVESNFFSFDDIEANRNLPPMQIMAVIDLDREICSTICKTSHQRDRCVGIAGYQTSEVLRSVMYYCIPANIASSVYKINTESTLHKDALSQTLEIESMHFASQTKILQNTVEDIVIFARDKEQCNVMIQASGCVAHVRLITSNNINVLLLQSTVFEYSQRLDNNINFIERVWVQSDSKMTRIFVNGSQFQSTTLAERRVYAPRPICLVIEYQTAPQEPDALVNTQPKLCTNTNQFSHHTNIFKPKNTVVCMNPACTKILQIPIYKNTEKMKIHLFLVDWENSNNGWDLQQTLQPPSNLQTTLGFDNTLSFYRIENNRVAINNKVLAQNSIDITDTANSEIHGTIFLCGKIKRLDTWVYALQFMLSDSVSYTHKKKSLTVLETVDIKLSCGIDNCIACQTSPPTSALLDLQSKCFAAAQCSVLRCTGTLVHMQRPLCNMGKLLGTILDSYRVSLQGLWNAFAKTLILTIEVSQNRRSRYEIDAMDDRFMAVTCNAKDALVEAVASLTSIFSIGTSQKMDGLYAATYDSRYHARLVLGNMAITNLLSSILMLPLYAVLALKKTQNCFLNDTVVSIQNIFPQQGDRMFITIGSSKLAEHSDAAVAQCLSQQMNELLRNLGREETQKTAQFAIGDYLSRVISGSRLYALEKFAHVFDAGLSYLLGIINGAMDVAASIDWLHCKPPLIQTRDASQCTCNDKSFAVTQNNKESKSTDLAFWCSGPLLLTGIDGQDVLVWNKYSLRELLTDEVQEYVECLASAQKPTQCDPPRSTAALGFKQQGVEILQVITKCRTNYLQKQWDDGVMVLALYDQNVWLNPRLMLNTNSDSSNDKFSKQRLRLKTLLPFIESFDIPQETWQCLHDAATVLNWGHLCGRKYLRNQQNVLSYEHYYAYDTIDAADVNFKNTDACRVFSGLAQPVSKANNLAFSPFVWSSQSENKEPVGIMHYFNDLNPANARDTAQQQLLDLHQRILKYLGNHPIDISDKLEAEAWSTEGDELHQIVDCFIMGPYASADFMPQIPSVTGKKRAMLQYHRGDPSSRKIQTGIQTQGSEIRKNIMATVQNAIVENIVQTVQQQARSTAQRLRNYFLDIKNLHCACAAENEEPFSFDCCPATISDVDNIEFGTKRILQRSWDIVTEIREQSIKEALSGDRLTKNIFTTTRFAPKLDLEFAAEEIDEMLYAQFVDSSGELRKYDATELKKTFNEKSVWRNCNSLLNMPIFTLPLDSDLKKIKIEGSGLQYNPIEQSSTEYLHGIEEIIERILEHAKKESPVYWSHVHRYVASESSWCEEQYLTATKKDTNQQASMTGWPDDIPKSSEHVRSETVHNVDFLPTRNCLCNWANDEETACRVKPAQLACSDISDDTTWIEFCMNQDEYIHKNDLYLVLQTYENSASSSWVQYCDDIIPSVLWGLLDQHQVASWFDQANHQDHTYHVSMHDMARLGPSGTRLGLIAQENNPNSFLNFIKEQNILQYQPNQRLNFAYNHTVGQPVCEHNLENDLNTHNLRDHFRDIFFPMAHSVHVGIAESSCSRWVVEFATLHFLHQSSQQHTETLQTQTQIQQKWRARCEQKLEEIGICLLRGVFDIIPDSADYTQDRAYLNCNGLGSWKIDLASLVLTCNDLFYITDECLIRCNSKFYDPSLKSCAEGVGNAQCPLDSTLEIFDVLSLSSIDSFKLASLHWPTELPQLEKDTMQLSSAEIDTLLQESSKEHKVSEMYNAFKDHVLHIFDNLDEIQPPDFFCDDLHDYWHEETQHPVGYHPTSACKAEDTNIRGFAQWMSKPFDDDVAGIYNIDPLRLRNMTQFSTVLHGANLLCDHSAYAKKNIYLNPLYIETKWDALEKADTAVPMPESPVTDIGSMNTEGVNEKKSTSVPLLQQNWNFMTEVGLIRDWLRHEDDAVQNFLDSHWPNWNISTNATYGLPHDSDPEIVQQSCTMPALKTCRVNENNCISGFVCLKNHFYETLYDGICVPQGSCFQHSHCSDDKLCSADAQCVEPQIFIHNQDYKILNGIESHAKARIRLHSKNCEIDARHLSSHGIVNNFAYDNGMCGFASWVKYKNRVDNLTEIQDTAALLRRQNSAIRLFDQSDLTDVQDILQQTPHACDFSFEHSDLKLCKAETQQDFIQEASIMNSDSEVIQGARATQAFKTHDNDDEIKFCKMPHRHQASAFMRPYTYRTSDGHFKDSLKFVSDQVFKCSESNLCPALQFYIDGVLIEARQRNTAARFVRQVNIQTLAFSNTFRSYRNRDAQKCSGIGYIVRELGSSLTCAPDPFVLPIHTAIFPALTRLDEEMSQELTFTLDNRFEALRQYCPEAFNEDRQAFSTYFYNFKTTYSPGDEVHISQLLTNANDIILQIFGNNRGLTSLQDYENKVKCATHLISILKQQKTNNLVNSPYRQFNTAPGSSLYLFTQKTLINVNFLWFWQCVITADSQTSQVSDDWSSNILTSVQKCTTYDNIANIPENELQIKKFLAMSPYFYRATSTLVKLQTIYDDVLQAIEVAIDNNNIPIYPDVVCLGLLIEGNAGTPSQIHANKNTTLFSRSFRDTSQILTSEIKQGLEISLSERVLRRIWPNFAIHRNLNLQELLDIEDDNTIVDNLLENFDDANFAVQKTTRFIERIIFTEIDKYLEENQIIETIAVACSDDHQSHLCYAGTQSVYAEQTDCANCPNLQKIDGVDPTHCYELRNEEYLQRYAFTEVITDELKIRQQTQATYNSTQLEYLLILSLQNTLYFTPAFQSGNLVADTYEIASELDEFVFTREFILEESQNARDYDLALMARSTDCSEQNHDNQLENNPLNAALRTCVEELALHSDFEVDHDQILRLQTHARIFRDGFFISFFSNHSFGDSFLEYIVNEDRGQNVPFADQVCFSSSLTSNVDIINPFWASDFDITTGCESELLGESEMSWQQGLRRISSSCARTAEEIESQISCAELFPEFESLSESCQQRTEQSYFFYTRYSNIPLCQIKPTQSSTCTSNYGALHGFKGSKVENLKDQFLQAETIDKSIWDKHHEILRNIQKVERNKLFALKTLPTDISGNVMHFMLKGDFLQLKCMPMTSLQSTCNRPLNSWLYNIENFWKWQNQIIDKSWLQEPSFVGIWQCPLMWIAAVTNSSYDFSLRTPSPQRNTQRFFHITKNQYAHPTMLSTHKIQNLMPARYISPFQTCTDENALSGLQPNLCQSKIILHEELLNIRKIHTPVVVKHHISDTAKCQHVLDWPFMSGTNSDHTTQHSETLPQHCSIIDRLPTFAAQQKKRDKIHVDDQQSTVTENGVCQMKFLTKIDTEKQVDDAAILDTLQYCWKTEAQDFIECLVSKHSTEESENSFTKTKLYSLRTVQKKPTPPAQKKTKCKFCPMANGNQLFNVIDKHGKSHPATNSPNMISTGVQFRLHPARKVSQNLRKLLCPYTKAADSCPEFDALFPGNWFLTKQDFWQKFLSIDPTDEGSPIQQDEALWNRKWAFCNSNECDGSISKSDWLQPATRADQCIDAVLKTKNTDPAAVQFCQLDGYTENFCGKIVEWNAEILKIYCKLYNKPECQNSAFFYTPTYYSIANGKFAAETVADFYENEQPGVCPVLSEDDQIQEQITSNQELLSQCAAFSLAPLKKAMEAARGLVQLVITLLYYTLSILGNLIDLFVALIESLADQASSAGDKLIKNVLGLLETIADVYVFMANAIYQVVFKDGLGLAIVQLLQTLCDTVNDIYEFVIINGLCKFLLGVADIFDSIATTLEQIFVDATFLRSFADSIRTLSWCQDSPLICNLLYEYDTTSGPATLPFATRCWSTYTTFFGDASPLSCTAADSCAPQSGSTAEPILCAECPQVSSFFEQFGCDDATKKCTCSTFKYETTSCVSNRDCIADAYSSPKTCRYLDADIETSIGATLCENCISESICFLPPGQGSAYCVCALTNIPIASCSQNEVSDIVMPPEHNSLCPLQLDDSKQQQLTFSAYYDDLIMTACYVASPLHSYCYSITNSDNSIFYRVVALQTISTISRRRLLTQDEGHTITNNATGMYKEISTLTKSPLCQDALNQYEIMPRQAQRCFQAYVSSKNTVKILSLRHQISDCVFCSWDDIMHEMQKQPLLMLLLITKYSHAHVIFTHSTMLPSILASMQKTMRLIMIDLNATQQIQQMADIWSALNTNDLQLQPVSTEKSEHATKRQLLAFTEIFDSMKTEFENMHKIHKSYANQISNAFNYNYPQLSTTETNIWLKNWPPFATQQKQDKDTCLVLEQVLLLSKHAVGNASLFYSTPAPQQPTTTLRNAWPKLKTSEKLQFQMPVIDYQNDELGVSIGKTVLWILGEMGFSIQLVCDAIYSIIHETANNFRCDIEAVQTCSKWNVKIMHAIFIVSVFYTIFFLVLQTFGLSILAIISFPFFMIFVLYIAYGYSILCVPTVPTCLVDDILLSLESIFPKMFIIPDSLLVDTCSTNANTQQTLVYDSSCFIKCSQAPFVYKSWYTVFTWIALEVGFDQYIETINWNSFFLPQTEIIDTLVLKRTQMNSEQEELITGNRICATLHSYQIMPLLLIIVLCIFVLISSLRIVVEFCKELLLFVYDILVYALHTN